MNKRGYKTRPPAVLKAALVEARQLFNEAKAYFIAGDTKMATRRVKQARRAAMRVQLPLPEFWNRYCRSCNSYLIQGRNSTIRVKKGVRILCCQECGYVRRKICGKLSGFL